MNKQILMIFFLFSFGALFAMQDNEKCSRLKTLIDRIELVMEGNFLHNRYDSLKELAGSASTKTEINYMRKLLCASTGLVLRGPEMFWMDMDNSGLYTPFLTSIKHNNLISAQVFLPYCKNLYGKSSLLKEGIFASEDMTRLLIKNCIAPLTLNDDACTNEPGCAFFKKKYAEAKKFDPKS